MNRVEIPESTLILNPDKSIYHIKLRAEHIADNVIIVGDQERVNRVSKLFDSIETKISSREFITHTGWYNNKRITVLSTGIGTDNIDIVINELDAAINIDFDKRIEKVEKRQLNIVRIGTSGALQEDIEVDSFLVSNYGLGLDGLLHYYNYPFSKIEKELQSEFFNQIDWNKNLAAPYFVKGNEYLINKLGFDMNYGITATAAGFYGPQGRKLRLDIDNPMLNEQLTSFKHGDFRITNFEMETSALYGLGALLGHNCCTVCCIIANRIQGTFSKDYKTSVDKLIGTVLDRLTD